MKILKLFCVVLFLAAPFSQAAQAQSLAAMGAQSHEMMSQALEGAIDAIETSDGGIITIPRFICPHAIMAIAAVGSGAVPAREGETLMMTGLVKDQSDMMIARLRGGPAVDLSKGNPVSVSFKLADGVKPDMLVGMAKNGIEALR